MQNLTKVNILGINVDLPDVPTLHQEITRMIENNDHALVLNVNAHCLNLSFNHTWMREFFDQANIVFCDGFGVQLGGRILGYHIPTRIAYGEWMWQLSEFAAEHNYSLFFLGARPGITAMAAKKLQSRFPTLRILGTQHGYFDRSPHSAENEAVIQTINTLRPDILVIGLGMPLQEQWLKENWHRIDTRIALTGGAVFDYTSGSLRPAPRWMKKSGLEWLGRMLIEPQRLWRRYVIGNPLFLWRIFMQRFGLLKFDR